MKVDWRALLILCLDLSGCATPAPAIEVCTTDWGHGLLYCTEADGTARIRLMKETPVYACEPAHDFASYVKYCRSKGQ